MVTTKEYNDLVKSFQDKGNAGITAEDIVKAVDLFRKNDFFREYYDKAPSYLCRQRIALQFLFSLCFVRDEALIQKIEDKMSLEDWKHLYRYSPNNPIKAKYQKKIDELSK